MVYKKKVPMRKCLGCNEMKPKKELVRLVRKPDGSISIDLKGKVSGRGCYICPNIECFDNAIKGKQFERALETEIDEEVIIMLKEYVVGDKE
ncbi:MAG: YlxR family protein [Firmicutes bacterium]|nr:YlxR family protein [Bacillota bacterium]